MERWLPIPSYEGLYEVSDLGRVKSLYRAVQSRWPGISKSVPERIFHPTSGDRLGHLRVRLSRNGANKREQIHRLVLLVFVGPCPAGQEARHLDGVANNNRLTNLEWGTPLENWNDRRKHGTAIVNFSHNTSGMRGVSYVARLKKWHTYIGYAPRTNLGWFATFEEARAVRLNAEIGWKTHTR